MQTSFCQSRQRRAKRKRKEKKKERRRRVITRAHLGVLLLSSLDERKRALAFAPKARVHLEGELMFESNNNEVPSQKGRPIII